MASERATIGNDGLEWPQTRDGMAWAVEFNKRFPSVAVDDALGWFCNAIMLGYDVATSKHERIDRALRFAAGMISTTGEWASKHPQECYDWLMAQTDTNPGAPRDGE